MDWIISYQVYGKGGGGSVSIILGELWARAGDGAHQLWATMGGWK